MFKKLKDKIAEEVKSSPQRIQQFAQAAQAAVTSASSSVSDITNNDLFSIGGDDTPQNSPAKPSENSLNSFQDVSLSQTPSPGSKPFQDESNHNDGKSSGRRLSTSSAASDVSFRLPSYESPATMYHLQSDMDVSASETEDGRFAPGALDHIPKEQIFAAYKRSQERYNKYRGRYADLARHYRALERENTKARAVLVETQDKALRRISELREQCTLEQSAKAHLENALRMDLEEKNIKIESLTTKIRLLQSYSTAPDIDKSQINPSVDANENESTPVENLIDLSGNKNEVEASQVSTDISTLEKKVIKYEQLASKYMEALRSHKEKNAQLTTELQIISDQLQKKINDNEQLQVGIKQLTEVKQKLQEANEVKAELQAQLNNYDEKKTEEISALRNEIKGLHEEITVMNRKEEENAISLAENKLSVHKELVGKENEIKLLKDNLEIASIDIKKHEAISLELQKQITDLEQEKNALSLELTESSKNLELMSGLQSKLTDLSGHNKLLEGKCSKTLEEMKRMEMQLKQEVAEKLAMTDRNNYLESRNKQLVDEHTKKGKHMANLEKEILDLSKNKNAVNTLSDDYRSVIEEKNELQNKYDSLETTLKSALENYTLLENKIIELTSTNEKLQSDLNDKLSELHNSGQEKTELEKRLNEVCESMNLKLVDAEAKLVKVERDVKENLATDMKNRITELEANMRDSYETQLVHSTEAEEKAVQNRIDQMNTTIEAHLEDLKKSKEEHDILLGEKMKLEKRAQQYSTRLAEVEEQLKLYNDLIVQNETLEDRLSECSFQINSLNTLKMDYDQAIAEKLILEGRVTALEVENQEIKTKAGNIISEVENLQTELRDIKKSHNEIVEEKNDLEKKITSMESNETHSKSALNDKDDQLKNLISDAESAKLQTEVLSKENESLGEKLKELTAALHEKEQLLTEFTGNNEIWQEKLSTILEDNNRLQEKCERLKQDKETLLEKLHNSERKIVDLENTAKQFEESKLEKEFLDMRIVQLESDLNQSKKAKHEAVSENESLQKEVQSVTADRKNKVLALNESINQLKAEMQSFAEEKSKIEIGFAKEIEEKNKVKDEVNNLKKQLDEYQLKCTEKNDLDAIVTDLQSELGSKEIQNGELLNQVELLQKKCDELEHKCREIELLQDLNTKLKLEKDEVNSKIAQLEIAENDYKNAMEELNKVKKEKSKLLSDIEGLQAHLTKVSKDNSQLNDQLRELLARDTSDVANGLGDSPRRESLVKELNSLREENSRLTERLHLDANLQEKLENLEKTHEVVSREKEDLERQLDAPLSRSESRVNYASLEKEHEVKQLTSKNKQLVQDKLQLESRIAEMELMGRSGDSSMRQIEQKNEKLRLMNEKLERRLDEALVSLRHFRSLEESTELEYLRNILYEYLTGPSTHTVTLAKVIAAVVKFDDRQTQLVLQREKERQGLLGQLGLL